MADRPPTDSEARFRELEAQIASLREENEQLRSKPESKPKNWRPLAATILLVIGVVALLPADVFLWANRTITDTDHWVATVGPVIHEQGVQKAIVKSSTDSIFSSFNIQQEVASILPTQAQPLAGPIAGQVQGYITSAVTKIVASDQFATVWVNVARQAQVQFMRIANSSNPTETVDVNRLYQAISGQLAGTPLAPLAGHQLPPQVGQITLFQSPALVQIPRFVHDLGNALWISLLTAVVALILALVVATDRRRAVWKIGAGAIVMVVIGVIVVLITKSLVLSQIPDPTYNQAAAEIWQALLKPLYLQSLLLVIAAVLAMIIAWFYGPAPRAVKARDQGERLLGTSRHKLWPGAEQTGLVRFLRRYHTVALWVLLGLTIAALLLLVPLSIAKLAWVIVVAVVVWLVLEWLVAKAPVRSSLTDST